MEFIKKHKSKLGVVLIVLLLIVCGSIGTPIVIRNIKESQIQAIKLESKADAKEAWQNEYDLGNIEKGELYYWNDGTYYWVIDSDGNINEA